MDLEGSLPQVFVEMFVESNDKLMCHKQIMTHILTSQCLEIRKPQCDPCTEVRTGQGYFKAHSPVALDHCQTADSYFTLVSTFAPLWTAAYQV